MQPVSLFHYDLLSRNHRDTNRKQNRNVRLKTTETGQVSTQEAFGLPFFFFKLTTPQFDSHFGNIIKTLT